MVIPQSSTISLTLILFNGFSLSILIKDVLIACFVKFGIKIRFPLIEKSPLYGLFARHYFIMSSLAEEVGFEPTWAVNPNAFRVRPVMTTSILFHKIIEFIQNTEKTSICKSFLSNETMISDLRGKCKH